MAYFILFVYIAITFLGSLAGARQESKTPEGYFLANRNLGTLALFFTILATNFSAFYFIGYAGEGYRIGYPYYVVMAMGTALACLSFFLIGAPAWKLGREKGHITPAELVYGQTGSRFLQFLFASIMLLFTLPYLALQIVGAGYILENITKGQVPYFAGASLLTAFTIAYVWIGGMRSVARTDLKQGLLMVILMFLAVVVIARSLGGLTEAHRQVLELRPGLFSREGADGFYAPQRWFSLLIFWLFCIPMFPQIFMRFYIARSMVQLKKSALLYAFIPLLIAIFPIIIGVLGHLSFPGLEGRAADQILPMMLVEHSSEWFAALVMTGALAAFMSTLDSQLLALSTITTRDFIIGLGGKQLRMEQQVRAGRALVLAFALVGLAIAYRPFATIFDMGKLAFSGLAVLFPVALFVVRGKKVPTAAAAASILLGEGLLLAFYYGWLPERWLLGFEAFIPVLGLCFLIVGAGWVLSNKTWQVFLSGNST
ncbi:MAG: sodium:solute symporter family protein [Phaeodactylibacter sp.]|nr:sodium:solute symporter family protein [Phaeodactylibacter sp.]